MGELFRQVPMCSAVEGLVDKDRQLNLTGSGARSLSENLQEYLSGVDQRLTELRR